MTRSVGVFFFFVKQQELSACVQLASSCHSANTPSPFHLAIKNSHVHVFICLPGGNDWLEICYHVKALLHHCRQSNKVSGQHQCIHLATSEANGTRPHREHWAGLTQGFIRLDVSWVHSASIDDIIYMPKSTIKSFCCRHANNPTPPSSIHA